MKNKKIWSTVTIVSKTVPTNLLTHARDLRKNQTNAETILWRVLRNRKLHNWKFRRQHPVNDGFILDFYCAETRVALELDGLHHQEKNQNDYDKSRTEFLVEFGIRVKRIPNEEVINNIEEVLESIITFTNSVSAGEGNPQLPQDPSPR